MREMVVGFHRAHEGDEQLDYLLNVFEISHFHDAVHVAQRHADQCARNAVLRFEDDIRVGPTVARTAFVLDRNSCGFGAFEQTGDDERMVARAMRDARATAECAFTVH